MRLTGFQVSKFRNVVDSGPINVDKLVTCLVGKNEAGKSALLEALYLLNPAYEHTFKVEEQYPRWLVVQDRKSGDLKDYAPIMATFELEPEDKKAVSEVLGDGVLTDNSISVYRTYGNTTVWSFEWSERTALENLIAKLPASVRPLLENIEDIDDALKVLQESTGEADNGEPLSEDLTAAAESIQKELRIDRFDVEKRIRDVLQPRLPRFFRFTSYSALPGRIDFQEIAQKHHDGPAQSDIQTARALLKLAGTSLEDLGNDEYELRKSELEAVQIDLTNQVFDYWTHNTKLEVLIDVDKETVKKANNTTAVARFLDIRLRDKRTGYSNNFSQRSSGFQWFFSFLAAFSEFEGQGSTIVLLDEPALNLHGKAQSDFLRFINERLAPSSPVIYTTHSPFMVEADRLERVRIVEDNGPPKGSTVCEDVFTSDPDSLFPLQAALGYDIAQNIFVGPHNLVVEGTSDFIYLTIMSTLCSTSGREGLDARWRILPAGGATNIPTFVSLVGPHLDVTVLADSDTKGMQRVTGMIERKLLKSQRLIMVSKATASEHADIEDLFSANDYIKLYNRTYGTSIKISDLPDGNRIVKRIEACTGDSFVHGEVAETFLRYHHELSFSDSSLDQFSVLIREINDTLET